MRALAALTAVAVVVLASVDSPSSAPAPGATPAALSAAVTERALVRHLQEFQRAADRNGGNRAAGTPGYSASVAYVRTTLERSGYRVRLQRVPFLQYLERREQARELTPGERAIEVEAIDYSPPTPRGGLRARLALVPVDSDGSHGCEETDYSGVDGRGAIALVKRGACTFAQKARVARSAGAVAVLVFNAEPPLFSGTLGSRGQATIPAAGISGEEGERLAAGAAAAPVTLVLELDVSTRKRAASNIVAETAAAVGGPVLVAGGHLDSVHEGPGINDNASGAALLLEIALQLRRLEPRHRVRFGFWAAEEVGLVGSRRYVASLSRRERARIDAYLNFDMVASPNPLRLVYARGGGRRVDGAAIERALTAGFSVRGLAARTIGGGLGGSDDAPFAQAGIATGGVFTGASGRKSPSDAALFGGEADVPADPCYHRPCDTLANASARTLTDVAKAAAHAMATLAPRSR